MATGVSENGILEKKEFEQFKARTVRLRFQQQMSYGIGAAMVFGLVGAIATKLFAILPAAAEMTLAASTVLPVLGLAAIGVLGIGCIYLSANWLSENTLLEQDLQAKKIGQATRTPTLVVEPTVATMPSMQVAAEGPDKRWADRVAIAAETAQKNAPAAAAESWAKRAANDEAQPSTSTARA
ncbi:MAG: hypothetical protein V4735_04455 [Pseudomonadota bacterium]